MSDAGEPVLPHVETTRYTAEQWKCRALYEEACKLSAERALARAMDVLREALFAAAHVRTELRTGEQGFEGRLRTVDTAFAARLHDATDRLEASSSLQ